jgi:phage terminase small subunit
MTNRKRVFVEEYLRTWNATQAALNAGYSEKTAYSQGQRLLKDVEIAALIRGRLDEKAMSADEVLQRLANMARGDMGDFLEISSMGFYIDLNQAKENGLTYLIKKVKMRTQTSMNKEGVETETHDTEIELYDAQAALVQLGRYHKLFTDKTDVTSDGKAFDLTPFAKALEKIYGDSDQ